jgi:hypothetical protein
LSLPSVYSKNRPATSQESELTKESKLAEVTKDLDIGLVVSNAGTGNSGEFLKLDRQLLHECGKRRSLYGE